MRSGERPRDAPPTPWRTRPRRASSAARTRRGSLGKSATRAGTPDAARARDATRARLYVFPFLFCDRELTTGLSDRLGCHLRLRFSHQTFRTSSGARGRHSRSARPRSEKGARLTPRAMASLLRSRSALQRASSALRARVVGVRPVPALSSIRHRRACSTRDAERARFPGDGGPDAGTASRVHARVSSPRASPRGRGRLRVRALAPRAPIARGVSRTPRVSRHMSKQSENSSVEASFSSRAREWRGVARRARDAAQRSTRRFFFTRTRLTPSLTPLVSSRPLLASSRLALRLIASPLDRARANSAGRTATSSPSSWTA